MADASGSKSHLNAKLFFSSLIKSPVEKLWPVHFTVNIPVFGSYDVPVSELFFSYPVGAPAADTTSIARAFDLL